MRTERPLGLQSARRGFAFSASAEYPQRPHTAPPDSSDNIRTRHFILSLALIAFGCSADTPATSSADAGTSDATSQNDAADASDVHRDATNEDARADAGDSEDARDEPDVDDASLPDRTLSAAERPAEIVLPDDYDANGAYPLVVALHGYGMSGRSIDTYFALSDRVDARQFLLLAPDGNRDSTGQRFWNATEYCCDHYGAAPDDATYISGLIEEASARFAVDPDKVFLMGFSNGGFMAYRLACDYPDRIAGVASVSGSSFDDEEACGAAEGGPRILHVHGTADTVVGYYGTLAYPDARTVAERWVERNGCAEDATDMGRADFDLNVVGDETWMREWDGCRGDSRVALWSLQGGLHVPTLRDEFTRAALGFLTE